MGGSCVISKIVTFKCDWCGIVGTDIPEYYGSGKHQCKNCTTHLEIVEELAMDALTRLGSNISPIELLQDMYESLKLDDQC